MSGKSTVSNEYGGWLNDIGLSGPIRNNMDYDEIPGFVDSSVFGRFSLDDLDFGDDLTKGRIDFDDEYLLKSPALSSISLSENKAAKAETRDSYPKRDSSGGYYHPPRGSSRAAENRAASYEDTSRKTHEPARRQMPTVARTIQENVFAGLEEVAGELNVDSKLLDNAKSFLDKAPTKWKLLQEQRKSSAIDRKQSVRNHHASAESMAAMENQSVLPREAPNVKPRQARQAGRRNVAGRSTGIGRRFSPIVVIFIMLLIMRLVAFIFQTTTHHVNITHTDPDPKPNGPVLIGGGNDNNDNQIPDAVAEEFSDIFNDIELWRSDNPLIPWMGLSAEETAVLMKEAGWTNAEITENDDESAVEADLDLEHSEAYIYVDEESLGTTFHWDTSENSDEQAEDEIKAAWGNLFPEDSGIYPGMSLSELRITDEMLQVIRDCGEKDNYGDIEESSLYVDGLFIALFENEYNWSLYINGDDTYIEFRTDDEGKYLESVYISGETNTWFA